MGYKFNGKMYDTEDEAVAARNEYQEAEKKKAEDSFMAFAADYASVGGDENKLNMLLESGGGLSQMSDAERTYITDNYMKSGNFMTAKYTKSATDQYLASVGLPPSSSLSKYRTAYTNYASSGSLKDNYGNVTADQWKKINELWAKDWEYGMTDADAARQAQGLAPVSYDSMYDDTLLDDELKQRGLPPSKLLNGKLGETYNAWVKDANDHTEFMDTWLRQYIDGTTLQGEGFDAVRSFLTAPTYTMEDAYRDTLEKHPEWQAYATSHFNNGQMELPDRYDDKYIMREKVNGVEIELRDENGQYIYDEDAWAKDYNAAIAKNAEIASDEFGISFDYARDYYVQNGQQMKALMDVEREFAEQGKTLDATTANEFMTRWNDRYTARTLNDGEGYTIELLFPDVEMSDAERAEIQPYIDYANKLRIEQGYEVSREYLVGGQFSADLKKMSEDKVIKSYRDAAEEAASAGGTSKYADWTDDQILNDYYGKTADSYLIPGVERDADGNVVALTGDAAKIRSGELTIDKWMSEHVTDDKSARDNALERAIRKYESLGLPTNEEEFNQRVEARKKAIDKLEEFVPTANRMDETDADRQEWQALYMTDAEFDANYNSVKQSYAENGDEYWTERYTTWTKYAEHRSELKAIDPTWGDGNSLQDIRDAQSQRDRLELEYYVEAVAYTPDFAAKTADMDYVNQRFEQIVTGYSATNADVSDLTAYATDDERRALVYLADSNGTQTAVNTVIPFDENKFSRLGKVFGLLNPLSDTADTYLNKVLLHRWDNMARADKAANTEYLWSDSDSWFLRQMGTALTTIGSIGANIGEGVYNFFADTREIIEGNELLSSQRATWGQDSIAKMAENISERHWSGDYGSFVYQLIPSTIQSGVNMWLAAHTGGASKFVQAAGLTIMSMESYSSEVDKAIQNGASPAQAYMYGIAAGVNEYLFEKVSLDSFLAQGDIRAMALAAAGMEEGAANTLVGAMGKGAKRAFEYAVTTGAVTKKGLRTALAKEISKRMLTHGLVEATEEFNTGIANQLAEAIILGYNSSYNKTVDHYVELGMSREEAEEIAYTDVAKEIGLEFVGGLVSGMLMVGGQDLIQTRGGKIFYDKTGFRNFYSTTRDLSLISAEDAINYAKANIAYDPDGTINIDSARDVFENLRKQGADAATLSRVRNAFSTAEQIEANQGAQAVMATAIRDQRRADGKTLIKAANQYVYSKANTRKSSVNATPGDIAKITNEYLDALSGTVQPGDLQNIDRAAAMLKAGYVNKITSMVEGDANVSSGKKMLQTYYDGLDETAQAAVRENAKKYIGAFSRVADGNDAGTYANFAAMLEHAVSDGDALTGLNSVFGKSANVSSEAIVNACLNDGGEAGMAFINNVCSALSVLQAQDNTHLFSAAQNGVDGTAYVASQMALAQSMPEQSMSRAMYDYIMRNGADSETMDLLTAANICDAAGSFATDIRRKIGTFRTTEQLASITDEYNNAKTNYDNKRKIAQAHTQADTTEHTEHDARIAKYAAQITELQKMMENADSKTLKSLVGQIANATSEMQNSQAALNTLLDKQNQRATQTQADLEAAETKYKAAKNKYWNAMLDQAAQYLQRFGATMEAIKGRQVVSQVELRRMSALVRYGTEANLNDINNKIIAAEKAAAVALGRSLGSDVQCVEFNEKFRAEKKIPKADWKPNAPGMRYGGTIYLNTAQMKPVVGSLTNQVLLHEIGHFLEESADDYKKFRQFAKDYFTARDGADAVDAYIAQASENADELAAEFARQVALADPRAVNALCKSAPKMSMRVFQWLTRVNNRMSTEAASQSQIVRDAQRAFARGIKAIRSGDAVAYEHTQEDAPRSEATRNAEKAMAEVVEFAEQKKTTSTEQTTAQTTVAEKTETKAEPQTESKTETQTNQETETEENVSEETAVEEKPAEEETEAEEKDNGYFGYDEPTESVNLPLIKGESLPDGEYYYDDDGNAYDESGNRVQTTEQEDFADVVVSDTPARVSDGTVDTTSETGYNSSAERSASLPFTLSSDTRGRIMRVVSDLRTRNADENGRVPKAINDQIEKIVKFQVTHDANYLPTPADILAAYADGFKAPQREDAAQTTSNVSEYQRSLMQSTGKATPSQFNVAGDSTTMDAYSEIRQDYTPPRYATEYVPTKQQLKDPAWYQTDEAKEYWANYPAFAKWAHKNLAWISGAAWNQVDIPYEVLMQVPEIQAAQAATDNMTGNLTKSSIKDFKGNADREAMRNQWLDWILGKAPIGVGDPYTYGSARYYIDEKGKRRVKYDGEVARDRQAFLVLGRPAAGKSKVFADPYSYQYKARIIDSDLIKEWTPEFIKEGGIAAGYVQDESAGVAQLAIDLTTGYYETEEYTDADGKKQRRFKTDANGNRIWHEGTGENIVIPRVGGKTTAQFVDDLIDRGYTVTVLYNDLPQAKSIMRAMSRYAETDRYLDIKYLHDDLIEDRFKVKAWQAFEAINNNRIANPEKYKALNFMEWRDNDVNVGEEAKLWWNSNDGRTLDDAKRDVEREAGRHVVGSVVSGDTGRPGGTAETTGELGRVRETESPIPQYYGEEYDPYNYIRRTAEERDAQYMPLAGKYIAGTNTLEDIGVMRAILDSFAMEQNPWMDGDDRPRPQIMYSAQKFGVNDFVPKDDYHDVNFATNHIGIADSYLYDRDNIHNPVRPHAVQIKDQYVLPDIANDENLIDNARRLLNEEYVPAESDYTEAERRESMQRHYDELANYANGVDLPEIVNLQEVLEHYLPDKTKDEIRQIADDFRAVRDAWHAAVIIRQNISDVFRLTSETSTDAEFVATWAQQLKALYNKMNQLFNEYDLGDDARLRKYETYIWSESLADYADELFELTDDAMKFGGVGMFKNNSTGELFSRNELLNRMKQRKNKAVYQLYGFKGNQPIDMNAHGYDWDDLTHPDFEGDTPRKIFKDARNKVGATSMRVRNTIDMSGATYDEDISGDPTGDDLLFPAREALQLYKSADLVTLDEHGDIIPPSQRFNLGKHDMAYYTEYNPYNYSKPWIQQVDDFLSGDGSRFPVNQDLMLSKTPEVWHKIGLAYLPVAFDRNHVQDLLGGRDDDHTYDRTTIENLPKLISDPVAILAAKYPDNTRKLLVLVEARAKNGHRSIIPIALDGEAKVNFGRKAEAHYATSLHGRTNNFLKNLLETAFANEAHKWSKDVFYWNKNKVLSLAKAVGARLDPKTLPSTPYVHNIHENGVDVKPRAGKLKWIEHQNATFQFNDWIKDSKVKSVLIPYRRGTDGEIWLTDRPDVAGDKKTMRSYANITNPLMMRLSKSMANDVYFKYGDKTAYNNALKADDEAVAAESRAKNAPPEERELAERAAERASEKADKAWEEVERVQKETVANLTDPDKGVSTLETIAKQSNISFKDLLKELGFDGAYDGKSWVALGVKQLKNAIEEENSGLFSRNGGYNWYTEYDPQSRKIQMSIDAMSDDELNRTGNPRLIQTEHGFVVARNVSREGLITGNPMWNKKTRNMAMIAPVSEFRGGDVGRTVPLGKCVALVTPNTDEYASVRADARGMGVNVYPYNASDPTALDRAVNRAALQSNVQFFPEETYDDFINRYGKKKPGAQPRVENRPVPNQTSGANRVSDMVRNAAEAPVTTDEGYGDIQSWITRGTGTYTPISNARTLERARGTIERAGSLSQAAADLHSDVANDTGKATDLLARAELLYVEAQNPMSGLTALEREQIFGDMCIIASDAGRALQAASMLKRMTPDGHIAYIEQVGKRMAERYQKRTKKRVNLKLTDEEKQRYHDAVTEEERQAIDKDVGKRFGEQVGDLTLLDRIRNWRYFSMLGNPRTHFRNIVGNLMMTPVARMKDTINAGYQWIAERAGKEENRLTKADRTTVGITRRADAATRAYVEEQLKAALPVMQGVSSKYLDKAASLNDQSDEGLESLWKTLWKTVPSSAITKGRTAFGRALNKLSSFNSNALEEEDAKFLGLRFRSAMYQIIQARDIDVTKITPEEQSAIVNYASQEALKATFRDASAIADAINRFARTNRGTQFLTEAIIPFKKTPINIVKRGIEYSPIGLVSGVYKMFSDSRAYKADIARIGAMDNVSEKERADMKRDAMNTYKAQKIANIDRLASGTTGSLLTAIGYLAASMGWISIGRKDDDEAAFEQSLGKNAYSLNIGDLSIDLSAFAPSAIPLLMGTALYESIGAERDDGLAFGSALIQTLCESIDPVTEMSMLSGIAEALKGMSYAGNEDGGNTRYFGTIMGNAASSYIGQFIPTVVGQIARVADPYQRSYTAGDDYWATQAFGSEVGTVVKSLQNKIPFVSWLSEPKVDLHGNPVRNYTNAGAGLLNVLNNFVLPATIKVDSKNEIDDELVRLYGVVDSADIFPQKPSRNLGSYTDKNGKSVPIKITSDAEYTQYQKEYGQTVYDMLDDLMSSMAYQRMTDEQKAQAIEKVIDNAKTSVRKRWKAQKIAEQNN